MAIRKPRGFAGFFDAASEAYGEGREEWAKAYREGRKANRRPNQHTQLITGCQYPTSNTNTV